MKFGDSLWQRSVPQWRSYNIDYDGIKHAIKENTTPGKGKAVSIPGTGNSVEWAFQKQLFSILNAEHDRLGRFVKSKWYEINSRLGSIERQLRQVNGRDLADLNQKAAWQIRRKFSRIESDILAVGEEIQNLSRYISINRLAIRKLCKKYTKWSGNTTLRARVEDEILNKPESLSEAMLKPALERYTTFLHNVRAPFEDKPDSSASVTLNDGSSKASSTSPTAEAASKSSLDFDDALETPSSASSTTVAKYWIHPDNVTQLRIVLLQHTRYAKFDQSRRRSSCINVSQSPTDTSDSDDFGGEVIFGPLESSMHDETSPLEENGFSCHARWCGSGDVALSLTKVDGKNVEHDLVKLPQSQLYDFLNARDAAINSSSDRFPKWLEEHQSMKPLACVRATRSRYAGLDNNGGSGVWAALDEDISMQSVSLKQLKASDFYKDNGQGDSKFPHAVLVVRAEGDDRGLFRMLDKSHLTERVPNFSIEEHALYETRRPPSMPAPSWLDHLHTDIRHVPEATPTTRSRKSSSFGLSSPRRTSRSGASASQDTPPTTLTANTTPDPFAVKSRLRAQQRRQQTPIAEEEPAQHAYWNEYDNPDSENGGDDGGYIIYIDPDAPAFPGQRVLSQWYGSIKSVFSRKKSHDLERQSSSETLAASDESDDEDDAHMQSNGATKPLLSRIRSSYGATTTTQTRPRTASLVKYDTPTRSTRLSTISLAAAIIILAIVHILGTTGRKKARKEVEVGVLVGVVASLAFVGVAMGNLIGESWAKREEEEESRKGRMWKMGVKWIVAVVVCVWAGMLGAGVVV